MLTRPLLALASASAFCAFRALPVALEFAAQSDLDAFMEKVLARRDDNWKKLQQYVLEEKEAFDLTGPGRFPLWGMRRDYTWFIRDGIFVRSPVSADGVKLSEADRRKAEEQWLRRQKNREEREKRNAERAPRAMPPEREQRERRDRARPASDVRPPTTRIPAAPITNTEDMLKQVREPQFVSSAYFLKFKFENGPLRARRPRKDRRHRDAEDRVLPGGRASSRTAGASRTRRSRTRTTRSKRR